MAKQRTTKTKHMKRVTKPAGAKAKAKKPKAGQPDKVFCRGLMPIRPNMPICPNRCPKRCRPTP